MEPKRRNQLILAGLAVVLAVLVYRAWPLDPAGGAPPASNVTRDSRTPVSQNQQAQLQVHLDRLQAEHPQMVDAERNLFRFKEKSAPRVTAPPPPPQVEAPPVAAPPPGPPVAPAPPPIALKFMGIVEAPERGIKVAAMSDQYGVYYGKEGDTILGQYKILRIGAESVDIAYIDGRGRQTIRLGGS